MIRPITSYLAAIMTEGGPVFFSERHMSIEKHLSFEKQAVKTTERSHHRLGPCWESSNPT